jgi:hypothetical protein
MDETPLRLSDVVRFELPAYVDAETLCDRLRPRWPGTKTLDGDVWRVSARVEKSKADLVALLRTVEAYVAEAGLDAIRYQLDGRFYIMDAAPRALAS